MALMQLKHIDLRNNLLGFKSGSFILKQAIDKKAITHTIDLQFTKVSELMINSIDSTLKEFSEIA